MSDISTTIVMPLCNGGTTIKKTLESLLLQSNFFAELIIINDNSKDDSIKIVNSILRDGYLNFQIINNRESLGLAESYNTGIRKANSDLVITMHQDVVLKENAIKLITEPFLNNNCKVVAAYHVVDHPHEIWETYNFWQKCLFSRLVGKRFYGLDGKFDCFRKKTLLEVGLFDGKNFRRAGEDGDIINKLKNKGDLVKTEAEIVHLHSMDPNFSVKQFIYKQAQYAEAQGALIKRHGITNPREFLRAFFREILIISLFIPFVKIVSLVAIAVYSFMYTREVYLKEWRDLRILALPFVNIASLFISMIYSFRGFIYGKQRI